MCGRYSLSTDTRKIAKHFDLATVAPLFAHYNIAPTQAVAAVRMVNGERRLDTLHWGLIPRWADDPAIGNRMINARAESLTVKSAYRDAYQKRRCLIPADGFYEWRAVKGKKGKQPMLIRRKDGDVFAFAGLWESWKPKGAKESDPPVESCTIITTEANDLLRPIHDRMPVIIRPEDYNRWLDPTITEAGPLDRLLKPLTGDAMEAIPVSTQVNNVKVDDPSCIEPLVEDESSDAGTPAVPDSPPASTPRGRGGKRGKPSAGEPTLFDP